MRAKKATGPSIPSLNLVNVNLGEDSTKTSRKTKEISTNSEDLQEKPTKKPVTARRLARLATEKPNPVQSGSSETIKKNKSGESRPGTAATISRKPVSEFRSKIPRVAQMQETQIPKTARTVAKKADDRAKTVLNKPKTAREAGRPSTSRKEVASRATSKSVDLVSLTNTLCTEIEEEFSFHRDEDGEEWLSGWESIQTSLNNNFNESQNLEPTILTTFERATASINVDNCTDPFEAARVMLETGLAAIHERSQREAQILQERTEILEKIRQELVSHPASMFHADLEVDDADEPDTDTKPVLKRRPMTAR